MKNEQFTPGPWSVYEDPESPIILGRYKDENYDIAIIPNDQLPEKMRNANAQLLSQSPKLYSMLCKAKNMIALLKSEIEMTSKNWESSNNLITEIESSLAKANPQSINHTI